MNKVLILDNYDSFTYNLVHQVESVAGYKVTVCKNDAITVEDAGRFEKILLSPGPGLPSEAGILVELIRAYASTRSILGVCLGHQAIAEVFGAKLINHNIYHGVERNVVYENSAELYRSLPNPFTAGRYHSWLVSEENFPETLKITSRDEEGQIMGLSHRIFDVHGVQFHPESIMTPHGITIISNWLNKPSNPN